MALKPEHVRHLRVEVMLANGRWTTANYDTPKKVAAIVTDEGTLGEFMRDRLAEAEVLAEHGGQGFWDPETGQVSTTPPVAPKGGHNDGE